MSRSNLIFRHLPSTVDTIILLVYFRMQYTTRDKVKSLSNKLIRRADTIGNHGSIFCFIAFSLIGSFLSGLHLYKVLTIIDKILNICSIFRINHFKCFSNIFRLIGNRRLKSFISFRCFFLRQIDKFTSIFFVIFINRLIEFCSSFILSLILSLLSTMSRASFSIFIPSILTIFHCLLFLGKLSKNVIFSFLISFLILIRIRFFQSIQFFIIIKISKSLITFFFNIRIINRTIFIEFDTCSTDTITIRIITSIRINFTRQTTSSKLQASSFSMNEITNITFNYVAFTICKIIFNMGANLKRCSNSFH